MKTLGLKFTMLALLSPIMLYANSIVCETSFETMVVTISNEAVALRNNGPERSISSIQEAVTKKTVKGFNKTFYKDGMKYFIHIEDRENLDFDNDFLVVSSPKGHKMTYSLDCSSN